LSVTGPASSGETNRLELRGLPLLLFGAMVSAGLNVALQIAYPLTHGAARRGMTIASVLVFFFSSVAHCVSTRSWRSGLALIVICVGGGLIAEAVGWRTGWPFGNYRYGTTLGPKLLGVPMVVPLAWAMMGWPALLAGRRVGQRFSSAARPVGHGRLMDRSRFRVRVTTATIGSLVLSSWDLFLDPQMVREGHWRWLPTGGPWLNGIPLINTVGWFSVGVVMVAMLDRAIPNGSAVAGADWLIWVVLGWVWFSNIVGHLVFFGAPWVALVGGSAASSVALVVVGRSLCRSTLLRVLSVKGSGKQRHRA
jgi:uncharacterized membrane protein